MIINKTTIILSICSTILFIAFMFIIYKPKRKTTEEIIKMNSNYQSSITIIMITVALISSVVMYYFSPDTITGIVVFVLVFYLMPYAVLSRERTKRDDLIFKNIMIYANNSIMVIKQERNVFKTLVRVSEDLDEPLKNDVLKLVNALEEDLNSAKKVFRYFEDKYNYTIVKQLDVLFLKMHYEDSLIREEVLNTLSDDVYRLSNDVEDNKAKRSTLRIEFILISILCLLLYFFVLGRLSDTGLFESFERQITLINILFVVSVIVLLFFVDQYFNSNLLRE